MDNTKAVVIGVLAAFAALILGFTAGNHVSYSGQQGLSFSCNGGTVSGGGSGGLGGSGSGLGGAGTPGANGVNGVSSQKFGSGVESATFGGTVNVTGVISTGAVTSSGTYTASVATTTLSSVTWGTEAAFSRTSATTVIDLSAKPNCFIVATTTAAGSNLLYMVFGQGGLNVSTSTSACY